MTVEEYINANKPFYHITSTANEWFIKQYGIKRGQCNAICVVRTNDEMICNTIATSQIGLEPGSEALIIKILPKDKNLIATMIAEDSVDEKTAPLHNYIATDVIKFEEECDSGCFTKFYVKNVDLESDRLNQLIDKLSLTEYQHDPIPSVGETKENYPFVEI